MLNIGEIFVICGAAFIGSTVAAISGFGGAAVLLPVLVHFFGVKDSIPILTVAQLIGNGSRVWFNRSLLNWKVVRSFALGAIPMALIGGHAFSRMPIPILIRLLGLFLVACVVWRKIGNKSLKTFPTSGFILVGATFSFFSALIGSGGPFIVPFFLAHGLTKGAFIGTEALSTVIMHVFKIIAYHQSSILTEQNVWIGLGLGPIMILGSWIGKRILSQISEKIFIGLVELILIFAGLNFLIRG